MDRKSACRWFDGSIPPLAAIHIKALVKNGTDVKCPILIGQPLTAFVFERTDPAPQAAVQLRLRYLAERSIVSRSAGTAVLLISPASQCDAT